MTSTQPSAPASASSNPANSSTPSSPTARELVASSRLRLWLPVPAWIAIATFMIHGEASSYQVTTDEFGFAPILLGLVCTVAGVVTLVLALSFSFGGAATRMRGILATTTWTAVTGVLLSGFGVIVIATGGSGSVDCILAGVTALVPLALALAVRPVDRRP